MGRERLFETSLRLPLPCEQVFPFFGDARNLQMITPGWLHFEILTPMPVEMGVGTRIDYRIRLHGVPVRWRTEITAWEPPFRFVDEQRRGPYRQWIHEHTFTPDDGGTLARDRVRYRVPGGALVDRLFVHRDVRRIFAYRRLVLSEYFTALTPAGASSLRP